MAGCARNTAIESVSSIEPIIFTEEAADKVAALIAEEGNPRLKLRVYLEGGGCAGFQYGFAFEETQKAGDKAYITKGVTLLVDEKSSRYLSGAKIHYVESLEGEQFVIHNPNAKSSCSCGSSFDID